MSCHRRIFDLFFLFGGFFFALCFTTLGGRCDASSRGRYDAKLRLCSRRVHHQVGETETLANNKAAEYKLYGRQK